MSITGIGGSNASAYMTVRTVPRQNVPDLSESPASSQVSAGVSSSGSLSSSSTESVTQQFADYMKETPAQHMEDAWLKQHGLTRAEYDAMPAAKKQVIADEMKKDLQAQMKAEADKPKPTNILA